MPTYIYKGDHPEAGPFELELTHDRETVIQTARIRDMDVPVKKAYKPFIASFKGGGWANH